MSEKKYLNGVFVKEKQVKDFTVLKCSIKLEDLKEFVNDSGYVNFDLLKRKEASEKGITHYAVLDEWKPEKQPEKPESKDEDLPF